MRIILIRANHLTRSKNAFTASVGSGGWPCSSNRYACAWKRAMTGARKQNPTRHRSNVWLADLVQREESPGAESIADSVHTLRPHHPDSACSPRESRATDDRRWVTELLNELDRESDLLRTKSRLAPVARSSKSSNSAQDKATQRLQASPSELSSETGREACDGNADDEAESRSPTHSAQRDTANSRTTAWPFALCGAAALTFASGVTAFVEFRSDGDAFDTKNLQEAHAFQGASAPPPTGSREVLSIPVAETVAVLAPDGFVQTDTSPSSALLLDGDSIERAVTVGSPAPSPPASTPSPARISPPQASTVRILAPPQSVTADKRPPIDVIARSAAGEEGAPQLSIGGVRMAVPADAKSNQQADKQTQSDPPDKIFKAREQSKIARPRNQANLVGVSSKLRRESQSARSHIAKVDRPRSLTLPSFLRPISR